MEGESGTCMHMHQHFSNIYCKFDHIPLMKHMVVPWKLNTDEKSGQAKMNAAADRYHSFLEHPT